MIVKKSQIRKEVKSTNKEQTRKKRMVVIGQSKIIFYFCINKINIWIKTIIPIAHGIRCSY